MHDFPRYPQLFLFLATVLKTEFQAVELLPVTEYSFSVSVVDKADNESALSDLLTFTTEIEDDTVFQDTIPPTRPTGLIVSDSTKTTVDFSWSVAPP